MEKEKKRMQQLCRKVCNMNGDASKASIYKGFGEWFHGHMGHETRGDGSSIVGVQSRKLCKKAVKNIFFKQQFERR